MLSVQMWPEKVLDAGGPERWLEMFRKMAVGMGRGKGTWDHQPFTVPPIHHLIWPSQPLDNEVGVTITSFANKEAEAQINQRW